MICRGCRHWDRAKPPLASDSERPISGFGTCERILRYAGGAHVAPKVDLVSDVADEKAFLADGSGFCASLVTREDFGCVLFEPVDDHSRCHVVRRYTVGNPTLGRVRTYEDHDGPTNAHSVEIDG